MFLSLFTSKLKNIKLHKLDINSFTSCYSLYLENVEVSNKWFWKAYKNIRFLSVKNQAVNLNQIDKLFPNLDELVIKNSTVEYDAEIIFNKLASIEFVNIELVEFPNFIFNIPSLESLSIGVNNKKIGIPSKLIKLKHLRKLSLYRLEITRFNYPFLNITFNDDNDFLYLLFEECTFYDFPKNLTEIPENFLIFHNNCHFKNYSEQELEEFHARFFPNAD